VDGDADDSVGDEADSLFSAEVAVVLFNQLVFAEGSEPLGSVVVFTDVSPVVLIDFHVSCLPCFVVFIVSQRGCIVNPFVEDFFYQ
jgi:hypothetical protein